MNAREVLESLGAPRYPTVLKWIREIGVEGEDIHTALAKLLGLSGFREVADNESPDAVLDELETFLKEKEV